MPVYKQIDFYSRAQMQCQSTNKPTCETVLGLESEKYIENRRRVFLNRVSIIHS